MKALFLLLAFLSFSAHAAYTIKDLGEGSGVAINDTGVVIGWNGDYQAVRWDLGVVTIIEGFGPGYPVMVTAINNKGQIVGKSAYSESGFSSEAFIWDAGVTTNLGGLGGDNSSAHALNEKTQIVGRAEAPCCDQRAVLWSPTIKLLKNKIAKYQP